MRHGPAGLRRLQDCSTETPRDLSCRIASTKRQAAPPWVIAGYDELPGASGVDHSAPGSPKGAALSSQAAARVGLSARSAHCSPISATPHPATSLKTRAIRWFIRPILHESAPLDDTRQVGNEAGCRQS